MKNSLQTLMNGLIDYAGLFPPAKLPLNEAVAEYISHFKDNSNVITTEIKIENKMKLAETQTYKKFIRI